MEILLNIFNEQTRYIIELIFSIVIIGSFILITFLFTYFSNYLLKKLSDSGKMFVTFGLILFTITVILLPFIKSDTLIFGSLSTAFGFLSVGLGSIAYRIGIESNEKSSTISNANFLDVVSKFEDRRIEIQFRNELIHISLWKAFVDMEEAMELLNTNDINREYIIKLIKRFNTMMDLVITKINQLLCEDIKHIIKMYRFILNLQLEELTINEANEKMSTLFQISSDSINDMNYLEILLSNIPEQIRWDNYLNHRIDIICNDYIE